MPCGRLLTLAGASARLSEHRAAASRRDLSPCCRKSGWHRGRSGPGPLACPCPAAVGSPRSEAAASVRARGPAVPALRRPSPLGGQR
eukprot:scaffold91644_cov32-Tisochrysis_lutea.AAC.1